MVCVTKQLCKNLDQNFFVFAAIHYFKKSPFSSDYIFVNFCQNVLISERNIPDDYHLFTSNKYCVGLVEVSRYCYGSSMPV